MLRGVGRWWVEVALAAAVLAAWLALPARAQDNPFAPGWDLDPAQSFLHFASQKIVDGKEIDETHSFDSFGSSIEADGKATITVKLESVNTKNDLRNVRMRFLFFEAFKFPEAVVTAALTPEMAAGLAAGGSKAVQIPFTFAIHGATNTLQTDALVTANSADQIVVTSQAPVLFDVAAFGLQNNLEKIATTAGGFTIIPRMLITYQLTYNRRAGGATAPPLQPQEPVVVETVTAPQDCGETFQILSEAGNILFPSGSAALDADSVFILAKIISFMEQCPAGKIVVAGHTDSDGSPAANQTLSERRAQTVVDFLVAHGIPRERLFSTGYGEDKPMVPNDSAFHKSRNRRIEFQLLQ